MTKRTPSNSWRVQRAALHPPSVIPYALGPGLSPLDLPYSEQFECPRIAFAEDAPQRRVLRAIEIRIARQNPLGRLTSALAKLLVLERIRNLEGRHTTLALTEKITHTAEAQVGARDLEA